MTELSPAAQAVWNAFLNHYEWEVTTSEIRGVAAALRAAAYLVIPEEELYGGDQRWVYERDARQNCREEILAIAKELESQ